MSKQVTKKNYTIKELEFITGMTLWNYGGISKAMMIRQQQLKKGKQNDSKQLRYNNKVS